MILAHKTNAPLYMCFCAYAKAGRAAIDMVDKLAKLLGRPAVLCRACIAATL